MRRSVMGVVVVVIVSLLATSAQALTPVKVLGGPEDQWYPFSNGTYLGWSQNSTSSPKFFNAWIMKEASERRVRINPKGTEGWFGGFDPRGSRAVFQLVDDGRSDIKLYDIVDEEVRSAPDGVNSPDWERSPRISANFLLFNRDDSGSSVARVMLLNRTSGKVKQLVKVNDQEEWLQVESVGERYAVWERCDDATCRVYVYDTVNGTTKTVPTDNGLPQYSPSLDEDRDRLYVVRSGPACGKNVVIWRFDLNDLKAAPKKMSTLPDGIDIGSTSVAVRPGRVDLMLQRLSCKNDGYGDIFALRGVDILP